MSYASAPQRKHEVSDLKSLRLTLPENLFYSDFIMRIKMLSMQKEHIMGSVTLNSKFYSLCFIGRFR